MTNADLASGAVRLGRQDPPRTPGRRAAGMAYAALIITKTPDAARRALGTLGDPAAQCSAAALLDQLCRTVTQPTPERDHVMTGTAETVDQDQYCLTVAASGAITDLSDIIVRGYLKEHPAGVLYRLSLLEDMIQVVRARAERELESGDWDATTPSDPADDHHEQVAEYAAHTCDCEWCLSPGGGPERDEEPGS
jgi:hypothetical protein